MSGDYAGKPVTHDIITAYEFLGDRISQSATTGTTPHSRPSSADPGLGSRDRSHCAANRLPPLTGLADMNGMPGLAETIHDSTDGPVPHARTVCLNRHFYVLPVDYIPDVATHL
jgi:hypothetical protein